MRRSSAGDVNGTFGFPTVGRAVDREMSWFLRLRPLIVQPTLGNGPLVPYTYAHPAHSYPYVPGLRGGGGPDEETGRSLRNWFGSGGRDKQ